MTKNKYTRAFATGFIKKVVKLKKVVKILILRLLRIFLGNRRRRYVQSGFVLPTTVMLLLVVTLVVTTIIFRTFTRTSQVISQRQEQAIYNSATPAIDRAKSKLEYLFRQDTRLPAGVPSDNVLQSMLAAPSSGTDTYTLPDETRLANFTDANNNPGIGWYFTQNSKTIAYSIIFKKQAVNSSGTTVADVTYGASSKAPYFVVRNGPVNTTNSSTNSCGGTAQLASNEQDWEPITSATLAKTFQVTALVVDNANKANRAVSTLELQEDKQADKGNKWGAYFRYDIEMFQGPSFQWNGSIHSDSNIFLGPYGNFKSYLISSPSSCVNTSANDSKVTAGQYTDSTGTNITFQGQFVAGRVNHQDYGATTNFDLFNGVGIAPTQNQQFTVSTDSVTDSLENSGTVLPASIAVDPVALFTQGIFQARGTDTTNTTYRDSNWKTGTLYTQKRVFNEETNPPYLDDTYRADDRYGPNPTYDGKSISTSQLPIPSGSKIGNAIPSSDPNYTALTRNTPPDPTNPQALGLDGYWERRAVTGGLRVIVGQRLELGNTLSSASNLPSGREHEFLQRRTQKDNLAAVQATAVYHYKSGSGMTPVACLATTVHPGTATTLKWGATFETITFAQKIGTATTATNSSYLFDDFFRGRGTNGWEFSAPSSSTALTNALNNLANFAGDPKGAFPPTQEAATGVMHPYPLLTQYGNFSNLRRALSGSSIADQSYQDTASCMLGMLAYNINYLNAYDYTVNWDTTDSTVKLLDDLDTALQNITASTPDQAIAGLEAANKHNLANLARLVATKEQVELDRTKAKGYSYSSTNTTATYTCSKTKFNTSANYLNKLCPVQSNGTSYTSSDMKYSALYYLFPTINHDEDRTDSYITTVNPATTGTNRYQAIANTDLSTIAISPNTGTWNTAKTDVTTSVTTSGTVPGALNTPTSLPNSNIQNYNNLVKYIDNASNTKYYEVAFKDAALFNGREMMSVRVLDVDLNLLKSTNAPGGDTWLPINDNTATNPNAPPPNGIVYAFREDAVREDAIARPAGTAMNAQPSSLSDPTITSTLGITTKPVDYYPDPDRRPYGFRLKNGSSINRGTNPAGMSFISDNSVYVQGDLNLHSSDGTVNNLLEEFTQKLDPSDWTDNNSPYTSFYLRTTRNTSFAQPATDYWRPVEILADSFTILSGNACDGSIEDGIIYPGASPSSSILSNYGCNSGGSFTSYLNQNRPYFPITNNSVFGSNTAATSSSWVRENPYDLSSPIMVSQNGEPYYCTVDNSVTPCSSGNTKEYQLLATGDSNYSNSYLRFSDQDGACGVGSNRKCIASATTIHVNATIVQNIIPSRAGQSYGGFHMFPRLNENWSGQNLFLSGAFIQLKFSTQATGAFDQDSWEPSQSPSTSNEYTWYFLPPNRLWGYDVALQYQTAGPVSQRFTVPGNTRSEIYHELAIDDPYILKLRCAKRSDGTIIDSLATCS